MVLAWLSPLVKVARYSSAEMVPRMNRWYGCSGSHKYSFLTHFLQEPKEACRKAPLEQ